MAGTDERDYALFAGMRIDHQALEFWRDDFILFRKQENCRNVNGFRICDAVQVGGEFLRDSFSRLQRGSVTRPINRQVPLGTCWIA